MALAVLTTLGCMLVWMGRRFDPDSRRIVARVLGTLLLLYVIASYTRTGWLGTLSWRDSLPLHLCNWVMGACIITLFRPNALGFEIAYFWGMSGTLQAVITPDLHDGFPSWKFIQFFWGHGGSLLAIVFMVAGLGLRPRKGSVMRAFIAINVYALTVAVLDEAFHWNYGYMCAPPTQRSLINHLGPWPWYILGMEAVAFASFLLLAAPWKWMDRSAQS